MFYRCCYKLLKIMFNPDYEKSGKLECTVTCDTETEYHGIPPMSLVWKMESEGWKYIGTNRKKRGGKYWNFYHFEKYMWQ